MGVVDLTGKRFGKLVVLNKADKNSRGEIRWLCQCDCGKTSLVTTSNLNSGNSQSCGCSRGNRKHGGAVDGHVERLYRVWLDMKNRCSNQNSPSYEYYGGRGISVCKEWSESYSSFRDWALANGYKSDARFGECTIDRIDNDIGYCPTNCRWVDLRKQGKNKRNNRLLHIDGEDITVSQAAEKYGIEYDTLWARLKRGWSEEDAVKKGRMSNQWG